jgi:SAM-dependent methyltransferase
MIKNQAIEAVDKAISELVNFDLVLVENGNASPSNYVQSHRHEYIRTVQDVVAAMPPDGGNVRVLEIGSFFGVVCMALKYLGYVVTASDIPEYIEMPEQAKRYSRHGIATAAVRLEDFILPFADETFDLVIMCEVLEHLNFNPLPLLKEINRIGKPGSVFYLSLPNGASIYNRRDVAMGHGIGRSGTVEGFFEQLNPRSSVIANGHWREYTAAEVRQMLEPLGFRIAKQYYFSLGETLPAKSLRQKLARTVYQSFPSLKENQTTIAIREKRTDIVFRIPSTVHRTLAAL